MRRWQNRIAVFLAFGISLTPAAVRAGIDFGAMPVGCSWTTKYSSGEAVTETFLGKSKGKFKTEVTRAGNPGDVIRTMLYDAQGRMVRKDWASGKWETFTPYSCFTETGTCTYRYRNADGIDQKITSRTKSKGAGFTVKAGPDGEASYPDEYFELGPLGLMTRNKADNYSAKLTRLEGCGLAS